ncbi:hypothetical protein O181_036489 [Austropuccinia psidii MF-1]|uniref:Uncharacterized protein n=1 Tax=Austropuccinia psidii MF-1 TaxID=1389203 RepID=A0A9Q3D4N3_9BASI|nr:hypothetical protein [Austropuccinia psidii MF-1]
MSPVHLMNLGIPRNHKEDRKGLSRTRIPGRGHHRHSGRWQDTEGNHNKRLLEERATRMRENQATIQSIEEQLNQTGPTMIPSGSQGVDQPTTSVASYH